MSAMLHEEPSMTIGEVLSQLAAEFPDISISKIRFLESEGLITPERAPSGYRRFTASDVAQLRLILTAQRDRYLPLRVIKRQLADGTLSAPGEPEPEVDSEAPDLIAMPTAPPATPDEEEGPVDPAEVLTRRELASRGGIETEHLDELVASGVVVPDPAGRFTGADLMVCRAFATLQIFGVEVRHLRQVKNAASRDCALITGAVNHLTDPQRDQAVRTMLDSLSSAHYWQVVASLQRQPPASGQRRGRAAR